MAFFLFLDRSSSAVTKKTQFNYLSSTVCFDQSDGSVCDRKTSLIGRQNKGLDVLGGKGGVPDAEVIN